MPENEATPLPLKLVRTGNAKVVWIEDADGNELDGTEYLSREVCEMFVRAVNRDPLYEKLLAEAKLYAPILEAAEQNPILWNALTAGTGIATTNGLRAAIAAIEEGRDA